MKFRTQRLRKRVFDLDDSKQRASIKLELIRRDENFMRALREEDDDTKYEAMLTSELSKHYNLNKKGKRGNTMIHREDDNARSSAKRRNNGLIDHKAENANQNIISGASLLRSHRDGSVVSGR